MAKRVAVSANKKRKGPSKRSFLVMTLLGLSIIVIGAFLQTTYQQRKLENKFATTEERIDNILSSISQAIPAVSFEKFKYCDRYNVKFDEGSLYCAVGLSLDSSSRSLTAEETKKLEAVIEKNGFKPFKTLGNIRIYEGQPSLTCRLDTPRENVSSDLARASFDCRSNSSKSFYPYKD